MKNWIIRSGFSLLIIFMICSCNKNWNDDFSMLTITIKDKNKNPVFLDDYFVINVNTGERMIDYDNYPDIYDISKRRGSYLLLTDDEIDRTTKKGTDCKFIGKINNAVIVEENYTIGNNGRHVTILSGKKKIIANL